MVRVQVSPTLDLNPLRESMLSKILRFERRLYSSTFKFGVQGFNPTVVANYLELTYYIYNRYNKVISCIKFCQVLNVRDFSMLSDLQGVQIKGCSLNGINQEVTKGVFSHE